MKISIEPDLKPEIHAANGATLQCDGIAVLTITMNDRKVTTFALICPALNDTVVIGWMDLTDRGILHVSFPTQLPKGLLFSVDGERPGPEPKSGPSQVMDKVIMQYRDVFDDAKLQPLRQVHDFLHLYTVYYTHITRLCYTCY